MPPGALGKESFSRGARTRRLSSPLRPAHQLAPGRSEFRCRPHSDLPARARCPALKSRGHSRSALGRSGSWEFADEHASRRQRPSRRRQSAPIPLWPAGGGSPPPGLRRLSPPPLRGGGGAGQPRLALAQVQQPVREKLGARPSSVSSLRCLLVVTVAAAASGAAKHCKSSLRDPGHLSPVLLARKVLSRWSRSPDFLGRTVASLRAVSSSRAAGLSSWGRLEKGLSGRSPKHQPGSHRR